MKTRIHDQFIRFRLEEEDVNYLLQTGKISQSLTVGSDRVTFSIRLVSGGECAMLVGSSLEVCLPRQWTEGWGGNEIVGFDFDTCAGQGPALRVVVEKDYPCIHGPGGKSLYGRPARMKTDAS